MVAVMEKETNAYLESFSEFEKELAAIGTPALQRLRKGAISHFGERGFPTTHDEEWRFTNIAPLVRKPFRLAHREEYNGSHPLEHLYPKSVDTTRDYIVFINGECSEATTELPGGVIVQRLATALEEHAADIEPHLGRHAKYDSSAFTALNTAFIRDGAFIFVPPGVVVERPIHVVYVTTARDAVSYPRNLVVAGAGSQVTLLECYAGHDSLAYFTNAVTEVIAGANAVVDHYKIQQESRDAIHVATMQIHQERGSKFSSHSIAMGGRLARNDVNAYLNAEGCECTLNGLYMANGEQLIDNHTRIDHAKPHCASHELYKGILDGKAKGVFNGKIYVHQDAQKTDAKQTNKTLLLSEDAVINTKPQLEIYADDVKCTHGATIGQLDDEAIFYMRARGLGLDEARHLLTFAFANDIISRIKVVPIRQQLEDYLLAKQHWPHRREVS